MLTHYVEQGMVSLLLGLKACLQATRVLSSDHTKAASLAVLWAPVLGAPILHDVQPKLGATAV